MGVTTSPTNAPGGVDRDIADYERLRHARERSVGFAVGHYLQPPPMLFTRDGHNVFLGDMYRGHAAFLVCGGPSLTWHDLNLLNRRGIVTMAVNNAAAIVRPNLWCSVDDPGNFADAIWYDPGIVKFVPLCHLEKTFTVRDAGGQLVDSSQKVGDMPAVFGFRRNEAFVAEQFLTEDTFNWGNHGDRVDAHGNKGSRSVMYIAIRLLYYLGMRTVYLLGCDFRMNLDTQNYAFEQDRSRASVMNNNASYVIMNSRFEVLKPYFEKVGLRVFNCTPNSGLRVFPSLTYEQAVDEATAKIPTKVQTAGMYDRKARSSATVDSKARDPSECMSSLPKTTLVIPVDKDDLVRLRHSWQTWNRLKPWIRQLPILILRHAAVAEDELRGLLDPSIQIRIETLNVDESFPHPWESAKIADVAHRIDTDWFWMLEPRAVATSKMDWLSPSAFRKDDTDREPVFTACRWGYTKPSNIYQRLDAWANEKDCFRDHAPLDWPVNPKANCIHHDAVATWSFLARTSWVRTVSSTIDRETPISEHAAFMLFCAERRRERINRISMKRFGWDHSFGWNATHIQRRCQEILAGFADDGCQPN